MTASPLKLRPLGATGLRISEISFGAGPVPALMTGGDRAKQLATVHRALDAGINWFDTAATYGEGRSESNLGAVLCELGAAEKVDVATKVRLAADQLGSIKKAVRASVIGSLKRLGLSRLTLIQLHNSITAQRGDQPTSITPLVVLGKGGVLEAFDGLRQEGLAAHFGLTGLGDAASLHEVIRSGPWATIQCPFNLLSAAEDRELVAYSADYGLAVLAIRVFAGGALAGQPPSEHTKRTPFFPLALYERDQRRAASFEAKLPAGIILKEAAVRSVVSEATVASAIIGFSSPGQVDQAVRFAVKGPLNFKLREA
jgi:aryl-alcohol dehydrogenase-like predicted oxidoreductase